MVIKMLLHLQIAVVQAGKDVSYLAVIVFGFAVAGFLLWSVSSEYFSSNTPSSVFTKALKRVKADPRVSNFRWYLLLFMIIVVCISGG